MGSSLKQLSLDQEEKETLKDEVSHAAERMMNHLLFGMRAQMKEDTFRDMIMAMRKVLEL